MDDTDGWPDELRMVDVLVASRGLPRLGEEGGAVEGLLGRVWGCVVIDEIHQVQSWDVIASRSVREDEHP